VNLYHKGAGYFAKDWFSAVPIEMKAMSRIDFLGYVSRVYVRQDRSDVFSSELTIAAEAGRIFDGISPTQPPPTSVRQIFAISLVRGSSVTPKENDDDRGTRDPLLRFFLRMFLYSSSIAAVSPKVTFFRVILNTLFKGHKYLCGRSLNEVVQHQRSPFSG